MVGMAELLDGCGMPIPDDLDGVLSLDEVRGRAFWGGWETGREGNAAVGGSVAGREYADNDMMYVRLLFYV